MTMPRYAQDAIQGQGQMPWWQKGLAAGAAALPFFNQEDSASAGDKYLQQIPGQVKPYYEPYIGAGERAIPRSEREYGRLARDPGGRLNEIGGGYQQSPGYQWALKQALQGGEHAANAGGMGGSPQSQQWAMEAASGLASKDYNDWLSHALELYGHGLQGNENLENRGFSASNEYGQTLGNNLQSRGTLAARGAMERNQSSADMWGNATKALAAFAI